MANAMAVLAAVSIVMVGLFVLLGSNQCQRGTTFIQTSPTAPPPVRSPPPAFVQQPDSDTCCAKTMLPLFLWNGSNPGQPGTPPPSQLGDEHNGLFTTLSATKPHFCIMHANPKFDGDLSTHVSQKGHTEPNLLNLFRKVLKPCCDDGKGVVIDVGGNFGLHAMYSAAMGCKVHSFEPMEEFHKALEAGRQLNCLADLVRIHKMVLTNVTKTMHMQKVPQRAQTNLGITSLAGFGVMRGQETVPVRGDTLDNTVIPLIEPHERVCLLKADVEGHEPEVMAGAKQFMKRHRPRAVVLEYSPGMRPVRNADNSAPEMLADMVRYGYYGYSSNWGATFVPPQNWDASPVLASPLVPNPGTTYNFTQFTDGIPVNIPVFFLRPDVNSTIPIFRIP